MHALCVQPACVRLEVGARTHAGSACAAVEQSRCSAASACALPLPTPTARSPPMTCSVPKCCRRCRLPMSSCSHHQRAKPAECWNRARHEHGIFVRGYEDRSSMKGCSLDMILRCVRAARASARDICSTLPARRDDRSRFTRSVRRMYLLSENALRV